jgi:dihydrofolate reductase
MIPLDSRTLPDADGGEQELWTPAGRDAVMAAHGENFDLLLGRRTYDIWSGFWPKGAGPLKTG